MSKQKTNKKKQETIRKRQEKQKTKLLSVLETVPIIQTACVRAKVGRTTYYRWRKEDKVFAEAVDKKLDVGKEFINDMAESQVINKIREGNLAAAFFWLKANKSDIYGPSTFRTAIFNSSDSYELQRQTMQLQKMGDEIRMHYLQKDKPKKEESETKKDEILLLPAPKENSVLENKKPAPKKGPAKRFK